MKNWTLVWQNDHTAWWGNEKKIKSKNVDKRPGLAYFSYFCKTYSFSFSVIWILFLTCHCCFKLKTTAPPKPWKDSFLKRKPHKTLASSFPSQLKKASHILSLGNILKLEDCSWRDQVISKVIKKERNPPICPWKI